MKRFTFLILCIFFIASSLRAQVAINADGSIPAPDAMLDVSSTTKGLLIPRLTNAQMNSISNPAVGLLVYVTSDQLFYRFDGNNWGATLKDNLGNHMATRNLDLADNDLTNVKIMESDELKVDFKILNVDKTLNAVGMGSNAPMHDLHLDRFGEPVHLLLEKNGGQFLEFISDWRTASIGYPQLQGNFSISSINNIQSLLSSGVGLNMDPTGDVGVGTTTPRSKLEVKSGNIGIDSGSDSYLYLNNGATTLAKIGQDNNNMVIKQEQNGKIIFKTQGATRLSMNPTTGYIGVGDITPTSSLDIDGGLQITGGNPQKGFILVADDSGVSKWKDPRLDIFCVVEPGGQSFNGNDDWRIVTDAIQFTSIKSGDFFVIRGMATVDCNGFGAQNRDPFHFRVLIITSNSTIHVTEEQIWTPGSDIDNHTKEKPVYYQSVFHAPADASIVSFRLQIKNSGDDDWDAANSTLVVKQY